MTYNTGNPIGSTDARDLADNAVNFDSAVNSLAGTWIDRLGVTRQTYEGVTQGLMFFNVGDFATGYTLTNSRQTLTYSGHEYGWTGSFPKVIPPSSTPAGTGGIGAGAWVDRSDVTLRSDLNVVVKVFESVADVKVDASLIVGQKCRTLGYYAVGDGGGNDYEIVAAATGTDDGGSYIDLSGSGFQAKGLFGSVVNVKQFGARGNGADDDTSSIQACINYAAISGIEVLIPASSSYYKYSQITIPQQQGGISVRGESTNTIYNMQNSIYRGSTLKSTVTTGNTITVNGGGFYSNRGVQFSNLSISAETSGYVVSFTGSPENSFMKNCVILNSASGGGVYVKDCWSGFTFDNGIIAGSDATGTGGIGLFVENSILAGGFVASNSTIYGFRKSVHFGDLVYQATLKQVAMQGSGNGLYVDGGFTSLSVERCHFEFNDDIAIYLKSSVSVSILGSTFYRNAESAAGVASEIYLSSGGSDYNYGLNISDCRAMGLSNGVTFIYVNNPSYCSGKIENNWAVKFSDGAGTVGIYCNDTNPENLEVISNRFESLETGYSGAINKFKAFSKALDGYHGIRFSSAPSSSDDPNTIDDYEEGVWTPVLTGDGGATGQSYSEQFGRYQKIGNRVYFSFSATLTAKGTVSLEARLGGLPFVTGSNRGMGGGSVSTFLNLGTACTSLSLRPKENSNSFYFTALTGASTSMSLLLGSNLYSNTTTIHGSGMYITA